MPVNPTRVVTVRPAAEPRPRWESELLLLRGDDRAGLLAEVRALADFLRGRPAVELADVAYTLNLDLPAGGCRLALVAATTAEALAGLERAAERLADPACTEVRASSGLYFTQRPLHPEGWLAFLFPGE